MKAQTADILGVPVPNWVAPPSPHQMHWGDEMQGRYVRLEPLEVARHCDDLFAAFVADAKNQIWDYLPYGPFATAVDLLIDARYMQQTDPYFFAIIDQGTHRAIGVASYLRINPDSVSIEVGHINFAPCCNRRLVPLKPCI